jgi:23S rRNA (cytosine1962-C5)-methyltransferase
LPLGWENGKVIAGQLVQEEVQFREYGLSFLANVLKGHKTGYFLDHRHNRNKVGLLATDREVLDVFSYAGGFSVHALAGGAKKVTSLDISPQAQDMARKNVTLNNLGGRHQIIVGDAFEEMKKMVVSGNKYDIVVIDPPTFASKESQIPKALHSYRSLVLLGSKLVRKGGILVMASCSSRVKADDFYHLVESTLKQQGNWKTMEKTGHDIDHPISFPEGAYLKCGYYKKLNF